jgi:hypothetical protein
VCVCVCVCVRARDLVQQQSLHLQRAGTTQKKFYAQYHETWGGGVKTETRAT